MNQIKLSTKREYIFRVPDTEATITFNFKFSEDRDYSHLSSLMLEAVKETDKDDREDKLRHDLANSFQNIQYKELRECIVSCSEHFVDEETGLKLEPSTDELHQKTLFEFIKSNEKYHSVVQKAMEGLSTKN